MRKIFLKIVVSVLVAMVTLGTFTACEKPDPPKTIDNVSAQN